MTEKKNEYKVGVDGRLYYTYNVGAKYEVLPPVNAPFTYEFISCTWDAPTETEYYRIKSAGKELSARFSVNQIKAMLAQFPHEKKADGEPVELPLLLSEVRTYYAAKLKQLRKANVQENEKLKGTKYNGNLQSIKTLSENLRFYVSNGDEARAKELQAELSKLEAEQAKLLDEKKVDLKILHKKADCELCNDTGIKDGQICECAYLITDKIKAYNASERLARH